MLGRRRTPEPRLVEINGEIVDLNTMRWWRRPRRLRRQLIGMMLAVSLLSVALVGTLNYIAGRQLLDSGARAQLEGIGQERSRSIDLGIERTLAQVSAAASDLATIESLDQLTNAFEQLRDAELSDSQLAELDAVYDEVVIGPINNSGLDEITRADVEPDSAVAQYLQYHYFVPGVGDPEARRALDDAGDGSLYSEVNAQVQPIMRALSEALRAGDILLISNDNEIIYSLDKSIDLGTSLETGPYADTNLASVALDRLSRVRIGTAVVADERVYYPAAGASVLFAAAAVRRDTEVLGTIAVELPPELLSAITTADERWDSVGLGEGESYVVTAEGFLRSESRAWIEDPQGYLAEVDDGLAARIELLGSPIGVQPVDTKSFNEARENGEFSGNSRNYLGTRNFSYATRLDVPGVDWIVVADVPVSDARSPLYKFGVRLALVLAIVLPLAGLIGSFLAARMTRPIDPVVSAARAVAEGDRNPDIDTTSGDEFGDLARQLHGMATDLGAQEKLLEAEFDQRRELLLTVLPARAVQGVEVERASAVDRATVLAIGLDVHREDADVGDAELADLIANLRATAEQTATDSGLERVRSGADRYLFVAEMNTADPGGDAATGVAIALVHQLRAMAADEGVPIDVHAGVATGPIASGVVAQSTLSYVAWGEPVRRALALSALSSGHEVLVDESTIAVLTMDLDLEPADLVSLDGQPLDAQRVVPAVSS